MDQKRDDRTPLTNKGQGSGYTTTGKKSVINYRPITIINVICKLFIMLIRNSIHGWVEESGMLGDVQGGFRRGRRTEGDIFMLERMIEMAKERKECLFVAYIDKGKDYDRMNRKRLWSTGKVCGCHREDI